VKPLELAQRTLDLAGPADGVQATAVAERWLMLRFARSRPSQATAVDDLSVEVTALQNGHLGRASTNRTDEDSLAACAAAAVAAAGAAARAAGEGRYPGFPAPGEAASHAGHDAETARLDPAAGGAALATAFEVAAAAGTEAYGIWTAAEVETAVASSAGTAGVDRVTDAFMKVTAIAPGGRSGYASHTAVAAGDLDARELARTAARKATAAGEPADLPPGEYPVVLERHAVAELLYHLGGLAFNGLAFAEGRSALCDRLGTRVAAAAVSLSDSPRYPGTLPHAFDAEGVPKRPLPLIQDGVAQAIVHDTRSAALAGARTTGHALEPGGALSGPRPTNLVLIGGGPADEAELCRPVERGVYVTRLWYVNPVRPAETLLTGVTRDGTFLIEDGEITRPLEDLRFTDSALGVLDRTEALASRSELTSDGELYGRRFATGSVCPALRAGAMRFTA
jgi:predicted Zn-dependent protease